MMKKTYIIPALSVEDVELQTIICNSITGVGGGAGVNKGGEEDDNGIPVAGDSRRRRDIWDDEEEEIED